MCDRKDYFKKKHIISTFKTWLVNAVYILVIGSVSGGKDGNIMLHLPKLGEDEHTYIHLSWVFQVYSCCSSIESSNLGHPLGQTRW